jgi:hypothetical protein
MDRDVEVVDFLDEFMEALRADLERGAKKWGATWLHRPRAGQDQRIKQYILDQFDRAEHGGIPVKYESIGGEALIGWIRDNHPELFPE